MSLSEALHGILAFMLAKVLAKDILLQVIVQDSWLEVKEAKQPEKVSTSLKIW